MSEGRLTIVVVALALLTFLGILSETSLNIAYSALMGEFSISADVVQWLTTGYMMNCVVKERWGRTMCPVEPLELG